MTRLNLRILNPFTVHHSAQVFINNLSVHHGPPNLCCILPYKFTEEKNLAIHILVPTHPYLIDILEHVVGKLVEHCPSLESYEEALLHLFQRLTQQLIPPLADGTGCHRQLGYDLLRKYTNCLLQMDKPRCPPMQQRVGITR